MTLHDLNLDADPEGQGSLATGRAYSCGIGDGRSCDRVLAVRKQREALAENGPTYPIHSTQGKLISKAPPPKAQQTLQTTTSAWDLVFKLSYLFIYLYVYYVSVNYRITHLNRYLSHICIYLHAYHISIYLPTYLSSIKASIPLICYITNSIIYYFICFFSIILITGLWYLIYIK